MTPAREALQRLREGNRRFIADVHREDPGTLESRRQELVAGQDPCAVILGCSDSRVPAEMVFDQGLGDLFVIRVAGNVVSPCLLSSVEFAVGNLGTRLVVVLGHSRCGAIQATLAALEEPDQGSGSPLSALVDRIRPAVQGLLETDLAMDPKALLREAVRANIRASAELLRHGSSLLEELSAKGELWVVGAEYSLETGAVDFFDRVPAQA